jgi:hypothetical protein
LFAVEEAGIATYKTYSKRGATPADDARSENDFGE